MWRIGLAALFLLHGLVHLLGFVVPFGLAEVEGFPRSTTVLAGRLDLGEVGIRVAGVGWLLVAVAFVAAAVGLWLLEPWWWGLALGVTAASAVLCALFVPTSWAGLAVDAAIVVALFLPAVRELGSAS
jgi:O-antigen ligase